jgi:hypothetical protein
MDIADGGFDSPMPSIDSNQAGTTIARVKLPTKNSDGTAKTDLDAINIKNIYLFDMDLVAKQKMRESLYDTHTLRSRKVLDSIMKSKDMKHILGDIHPELTKKAASKIASQKGTFIDGLKDASWAAKAFFKSVRYLKMTKLKTWDQWIKQPASIIAHSYGTIGARATTKAIGVYIDMMTSKKAREAFNNLVASSEIANRVTDGEWVIKNQESIIKSLIKAGKLDKTVGAKVYDAVFDNALQHGDLFATRLSWIAAYMKELKKAGKINSYADFNIEEAAKNPDFDAISNADSMSQDINNYSDFSDAPDMFKKGDKTYIREALYNFRSFSVNMTARNLIAVRDLVNSKNLDVDKKAAVRQLVGSALATITFQAMKEFVVNELWEEILEHTMGIEDEETDWNEKINKVLARSASDYLVGGAIGGEATESVFKHLVNAANEIYITDIKKEKYNPYRDKVYFVGSPDKGVRQYLPGSYGMPFEISDAGWAIYDDLMEKGKLSEKTEYQTYAAIALILGEGSVDRMFSKAYYKAKKESSKGRTKGRTKGRGKGRTKG